MAVQKAALPTVVDLSSRTPAEAQLQGQEFERQRLASLVQKLELRMGFEHRPRITPVSTTTSQVRIQLLRFNDFVSNTN